MLVIGNGELNDPLGDSVTCPHCGKVHEIQYGEEVMKDGTRKPSKLLAFYKCGEKSFLAGFNGFALPQKNNIRNE